MGQPAARATDPHACPMFDGPKPHVGGLVSPIGAVPTVLIGGLPAATMGTVCVCMGLPNAVAKGSTGVFIGGRPAARLGDSTLHGGAILSGCLTVLIGDVGMTAPGDFDITVVEPSIWDMLGDSPLSSIIKQEAGGDFSTSVIKPSLWDKIMGKPLIIKYGNIEILPDPKDPNFQYKTIRDLVWVNSTLSGHKLLQSINDSGKKVTIQHTKDKNKTLVNETSERKPNGTPGTPGDAQIYYNPDREVTHDGSEPWQTRPAAIGLGHELIHADHGTHGTTYTGESQNDNMKDPKNPSLPLMEDNDELQTAGIPMPDGSPRTQLPGDSGVTENQIRKEWPTPQPPRPWY